MRIVSNKCVTGTGPDPAVSSAMASVLMIYGSMISEEICPHLNFLTCAKERFRVDHFR